ncbi:AraC family transcriptional regulator [Microbacterium sp.]|uniref:AraC family transcriptional regulator n=1 Tax=Microbacterium sp. TaxID=51671 RepID=UPI003A89F808
MIRDGSLLIDYTNRVEPVGMGDVVMVAPHTAIGYEREGKTTVTTLFADTDYLIEHLFWQHLDLIPDRDAARDLAAKLYPDPVQVLRLGECEVERLGPILDELVALTATGQGAAGYFHVHGLLFTLLEAITPHVHHAAVEIPPLTSRQRVARVAAPRWQRFRPVRREAARVAALMRSDITQPWRLDHLAAHACLSKSQLTRVFKESFGVTPLVYLSILRVREMARLIRETDLLITVITERVGWCYHSGCATRVFRRYMGVTPIRYRHYGPPNASRDGPGIGVARAAGQRAAG